MTAFFPLYVNIVGKCCVVVGGGSVAERKVNDLLEAGAKVRVVSPEITPRLQEQVQAAAIEWLPTGYTLNTIEDAWLVFAATNVRSVNAQIAHEANTRRLFVNVVDAPEEGSFIVPSVVRRGDLCLSVSTGGANPLLARRIAEELQGYFGQEYSLLVELLGHMRAYTKERTPLPALRREALSQLVTQEADIRALLRADDLAGARRQAEMIVNNVIALRENAPETDPVINNLE